MAFTEKLCANTFAYMRVTVDIVLLIAIMVVVHSVIYRLIKSLSMWSPVTSACIHMRRFVASSLCLLLRHCLQHEHDESGLIECVDNTIAVAVAARFNT